jgi:hypothetical protein
MSTVAMVIGLAAAVCTTAANLPQLKKAWITGQTDDLSAEDASAIRIRFGETSTSRMAHGRCKISLAMGRTGTARSGLSQLRNALSALGQKQMWQDASATSAFRI